MTDENSIRCIMCGTEVTPRQLIGNALENGAAPKLAAMAIQSTRLYTDELGALRHRVAQLETIEGIGKQAGAWLIEALDLYAKAECVGPTRQELARIDEMRAAVGLCALDDVQR